MLTKLKSLLRQHFGSSYQVVAKYKSLFLTSISHFFNFFGLLRFYTSTQNEIVFSDKAAQIFFGYFDLNPFSSNNEIILAHRLFYFSKDIKKGTHIDVGFYRRSAPADFIKLGQTTAWSWQQASRLQWFDNDRVMYNIFDAGIYKTKIVNIHTTESELLPLPTYCHNSKIILSIDFVRLERLRPGYGYIDIEDITKTQNIPHNDGIWSFDLLKKEKKLLISYDKLVNYDALPEFKDSEHYLNHLVFRPDGQRFVFFHIWTKSGKRKMRMFSSDLDGSLQLIYNEGHISHFCWLNNESLLAYSTHKNSGSSFHFYLDDLHHKQTPKRIEQKVMQEDGHPYAIPNSHEVIIDTYPNSFGLQKLYIFDYKNASIRLITRCFSPFKFRGVTRCDLHPKVSCNGKWVSIDCINKNKRQIKVLEI